MSKTYDALMKLLDEKGSIPDGDAAKLIKEHGPLDEEEKKKIAAAIKMAKVLGKSGEKEKSEEKTSEEKEKAKTAGEKDKDEDKGKDEKKDKPSDDDVTMDDYLLALSVLDSEAASKEDKEKAQKAKDKFESQ